MIIAAPPITAATTPPSALAVAFWHVSVVTLSSVLIVHTCSGSVYAAMGFVSNALPRVSNAAMNAIAATSPRMMRKSVIIAELYRLRRNRLLSK
ncbi:hypothetical protein FH608_042805 [Nonomuraea phyllanthi]|uniref:Uncharacterized protein n=1 Tax=Nonomuraea phyllanthi TaxID=2219224 RepID=A0A5C4VG94_9ACTN|nr:hypothetical protein FH608_042805 [Nonomuraea phyllanthi]